MFCKNCGQNVPDGTQYCSNCGMNTGAPDYQQPVVEEKSNIWLNILSFCIPLVGIIIYFVKKDENRAEAKGALKAAVISIVLGIVISILMFVATFALGLAITGGVMNEASEIIDSVEDEIDLEDHDYDYDLDVNEGEWYDSGDVELPDVTLDNVA